MRQGAIYPTIDHPRILVIPIQQRFRRRARVLRKATNALCCRPRIALYSQTMTRLRRKIVAYCTVSLLLFAQVAVAGYACPSVNRGASQKIGLHVVAKPCHHTNSKNLNLCKQHCDHSAQSVDSRIQSQIDGPVLPPVVATFQADVRPSKLWVALAEFPADFTKPPLYIHHCRFLI